MFGAIVFLHVVASAFLVVIILMQSGRGGGLTEAFSSAESMFGAKTNEFLVKGTTLFAVLFLVTSLSLAFISSRRGKSIMSDDIVAQETAQETSKAEENAKLKETDKVQEAVKAVEAAVPEAEAPVAADPKEPVPSPVK